MNFKKVIVTGAAAALCVGSVLNVSAAEAVSGSYRDALKGKENLIIDVEAYKAAYSDLAAAFGDNDAAYIEHYLTTGIYEGRTKGVLFDPLAYAEAYSDVEDAFGDNVLGIVSHYVTFGAVENRTAGTAAGYADIAQAREQTGGQKAAAVGNSAAAGGSSPVGNVSPAVNVPAAGNGSAAAVNVGGIDTSGYRTVRYYARDEVTLIRVEYYDANNRLVKYSVVNNFDSDTKSYTEDVYHYEEESQQQILEGTRTGTDTVGCGSE